MFDEQVKPSPLFLTSEGSMISYNITARLAMFGIHSLQVVRAAYKAVMLVRLMPKNAYDTNNALRLAQQWRNSSQTMFENPDMKFDLVWDNKKDSHHLLRMSKFK